MASRAHWSSNGTTLLELMVSFGIIGLLLSIGIPQYLERLPLRRLKSSAMEVAAQMRLARMKAISLGINCGVSLSIGANSITVFIDSGSEPNQFDPDDEIIKKDLSLRKGIIIYENSFSGDGSAIFRPRGSAKGGSVRLTNGTQTIKISVLFTTGRIRIKSVQP